MHRFGQRNRDNDCQQTAQTGIEIKKSDNKQYGGQKTVIQKKNNSTQVVIQKSLTEKETELLTKVLNIINSDEKNIEEILNKI